MQNAVIQTASSETLMVWENIYIQLLETFETVLTASSQQTRCVFRNQHPQRATK